MRTWKRFSRRFKLYIVRPNVAERIALHCPGDRTGKARTKLSVRQDKESFYVYGPIFLARSNWLSCRWLVGLQEVDC